MNAAYIILRAEERERGRNYVIASLVPRPSLLYAIIIRATFVPLDMRGPGRFYHVSDVEGREKVERT